MSRKERFDQLIRSHLDDLNRYAVWLCRDPALAADLVQETFLRAWKAFDRLRDEAAAKSWLITILRREYARTFERKVPQLISCDETDLEDLGMVGPDDRAEVRQLRAAMLALDRKYREPIVLQVIGGFTCAEIAQLLGLSRSAVMTQLFRARKQLKAALGEELDEDID